MEDAPYLQPREQYLADLARRPADAWAELRRLFHQKKDTQALRLLLDLSLLAADPAQFLQGVHEVDRAHAARRARRVRVPVGAASSPRRRTARRKPKRQPTWAQVKVRCRLGEADVTKARALQLRPREVLLHRPVSGIPQWLDDLYHERFGPPLFPPEPPAPLPPPTRWYEEPELPF